MLIIDGRSIGACFHRCWSRIIDTCLHLLKLQDGETALIVAAKGGHTECVRLLLDCKVEKDARDKVRDKKDAVLAYFFSFVPSASFIMVHVDANCNFSCEGFMVPISPFMKLSSKYSLNRAFFAFGNSSFQVCQQTVRIYGANICGLSRSR